jgi:Zn-dependent protease
MAEAIQKIREVFPGDGPVTEILSFIVGTTPLWLAMGVGWWFLNIGDDSIIRYSETATGLGLALFTVGVGLVLGFGLHEAAHRFVAVNYCGRERSHFDTFYFALRRSMLGAVWAIGLVVVQLFTPIDLVGGLAGILESIGLENSSLTSRALLISFIGGSPGGVIPAGKPERSHCTDEIAIAGPLTNLLLALVLFWVLGGLPAFDTETGLRVALHNALTFSFYFSMLLALMNALPFPPLDGNKVWNQREPITVLLQALCILVPLATFGTVIL